MKRRHVLGALGGAAIVTAAGNLSAAQIMDCRPADKSQSGRGRYRLRADKPRQIIKGLGFEIQSDSIGSGNVGMPDEVVAVPHNLVAREQERLYSEMLRGFRYCRLAMGLYLRGLDDAQERFRERYAGQMSDLREMAVRSRIEGFAIEYWSPAPAWKSNGAFEGGRLKSFQPQFLSRFADALVDDLRYLGSHGLEVVQWGLQNEPIADSPGYYSTCGYSASEYTNTLTVVAPKIKAALPDVFLHVNSWDGQRSATAILIKERPELFALVDGWSWHRIGVDSNEQMEAAAWFTGDAAGKPVFNNEFEYLVGGATDDRMINTAQSIMNWFTFIDSPFWFWLHALKPVANAEASAMSLGFWQPPVETNSNADSDKSGGPSQTLEKLAPEEYRGLKPGHWTFNKKNWHALAGFLRHLPWDSQRLQVNEDIARQDNRILAWRSPAGKLGIALTNRSGAPFTFEVDLPAATRMSGWRYTPNEADVSLGQSGGKRLVATLPNHTIEFWIEL